MNTHYLRYLRSPAWQEKRRQVLERDGYRCQAFTSHHADQVHHKSYANVGHEPLDDLMSLCSPCHAALTRVMQGERTLTRQVAHQQRLRLVTPTQVKLTQLLEAAGMVVEEPDARV